MAFRSTSDSKHHRMAVVKCTFLKYDSMVGIPLSAQSKKNCLSTKNTPDKVLSFQPRERFSRALGLVDCLPDITGARA